MRGRAGCPSRAASQLESIVVLSVDVLQVGEHSDLLVSEEGVQQALDALAAGIAADLAAADPLLICVMNGGLFTTSELARRFAFPLQMDYLQVSRYGTAVQGSQLKWLSRPQTSLVGRTVLLTDDILDRGETLAAVCAWCREAGAARVLSAVLVDKQVATPRAVRADYAAMLCPDRYLYGCGMDYRGYWRNLPAIYGVRDDYLQALEAAKVSAAT